MPHNYHKMDEEPPRTEEERKAVSKHLAFIARMFSDAMVSAMLYEQAATRAEEQMLSRVDDQDIVVSVKKRQKRSNHK